MLVELLSNTSPGLPLVALIADLIACDARFNDWLAVDGKRTLSDDEMLETIDAYEDATTHCLASIKRFESSTDLVELETVLRQTLEALQRPRRR